VTTVFATSSVASRDVSKNRRGRKMAVEFEAIPGVGLITGARAMPTRPRHLISGALLMVASLATSAAGRYADSATIASVASAVSQESSGIGAKTTPAAPFSPE
jgi:hypothetical protein